MEAESSPEAAAACVNCGLSLKRKWKGLAVQQSVENIAFISENIAPNVLTECDYVCKPCSQLSVKIMDTSKIKTEEDNDSMEIQQPEDSRLEKQSLKQACLLCGISLIGRKSRLILKDNSSDFDHLMCKVIKNASSPKTEITAGDKLCTKCWATYKRTAFEFQEEHQSISGVHDSTSSNPSEADFPENGYDEPLISPIKSEPEDDDFTNMEIVDRFNNKTLNNGTKHGDSNKSNEESEDDKESNKSEPFCDDPEDLDFIPSSNTNIPSDNMNTKQDNTNEPEENSEILLPNYRRSPNRSRRCIFTNCKNNRLMRVRTEIRARVLRDHRYFITERARVCANHLLRDDWDKLYNQKYSSIPIFRAADVENVINLVRIRRKRLDFDNTLNLDGNLFEFLLGITKEIFSDILEKIPELNNLKMGLVALLINHHKKSNNYKRLSRLLNVSSTTMRYHMNAVKRILTKHHRTKELGIEYLLKE